jgi:hypothetical protein
MTKYYRGHTQRHATFWVHYRELPHEERFASFIGFFKEVEQEVKDEKCSLRDAGYALEPGYYDDDIQASSHSGDMTMACLIASDLARWFYDYTDEAADDWEVIVGIMQKYLS